MKIASKVRNGEVLSSSLSFFLRTPELCPVKSGKEFLDPKVQRKIYQDRTSRLEKRSNFTVIIIS